MWPRGGIRLVDIDIMFKALKLAWIPRLLIPGNQNWETVPDYYLRKFTLGARDFSCAVSGFGQAFISDPREKPLDRSAISLMAPNQSQARLNQFSPDFGRES